MITIETTVTVPIDKIKSKYSADGLDMLDLISKAIETEMLTLYKTGYNIDSSSFRIMKLGSEEFGEKYLITFVASK